jgi:hypothetical protein
MAHESITRNRDLLRPTARGVLRGLVHRGPEFRHHVARDAWTIAKRFAAPNVVNIEKREMPGVMNTVVEGYIDDHQRMLIAALAKTLGFETFFEIGTNRGRTTWTVARNCPGLQAYTLDLGAGETSDDTELELASDDVRFLRPDDGAGEAFRGTPEEDRITQLWGDSATFDFSPYERRMDLVYVKRDTRTALSLLSRRGMIVWDDYGSNPGVYRAVNEIAPTLEHPVYHVFGTRMAVYARSHYVVRLPFDDHASLPTV